MTLKTLEHLEEMAETIVNALERDDDWLRSRIAKDLLASLRQKDEFLHNHPEYQKED